jgi:hypothetical protein
MYIPDCIRDFGPMHGFWTFLFERLNKVLKSYNSANHAAGELEVSFFCEFHRTVLQSRVVSDCCLLQFCDLNYLTDGGCIHLW